MIIHRPLTMRTTVCWRPPFGSWGPRLKPII